MGPPVSDFTILIYDTTILRLVVPSDSKLVRDYIDSASEVRHIFVSCYVSGYVLDSVSGKYLDMYLGLLRVGNGIGGRGVAWEEGARRGVARARSTFTPPSSLPLHLSPHPSAPSSPPPPHLLPQVTPGIRGVKPATVKMIDATTKEHVETLEVDAVMVRS